MSWEKVGETISKYAPVIGGLVGGPGGAAIGQTISTILGVSNNPEIVHRELTQNPDTIEKIKELELSFIQAQSQTTQTMLKVDAKSTHTTRPKIAYQAFQVLAFITVVIVLFYGYAIAVENTELVNSIVNGWPFVGGLITPFVLWLNAYFGVLRRERADELNANNGHPILNTLSNLWSKK